MIVDATDEEIDVLLEQVVYGVNRLTERVRYLRKRLEDAERVIHTIGFSSGRLDVCGGSEESLLNLCKDVRMQLDMDAGSYWQEYGDKPLHPQGIQFREVRNDQSPHTS